MIWIFPMAGYGVRTQTLGQFKPFIQIRGRRMVEWLLRSLRGKIAAGDKTVFITTEHYASKFEVESNLEKIMARNGLDCDVHLVTCPTTPPGPAASVYTARAYYDRETPVIVVNCDQYIDFDMFNYTSVKQGFLPVYANFGNTSSYVDIRDGRITRIVEKQNISNLASAGVYSLASGKALICAIEKQFEKKDMTNGEYYVGPAMNTLIADGYELYPVAVRSKYDLGNVQGIEYFQETVFCEQAAGGCL